MRVLRLALGLSVAWAAAGEAPRDGHSLLASGNDKFFAGDLEAAAADWAGAAAANQSQAAEFAVLACSVLAKEALRADDGLSALIHAGRGLEVASKDPVLLKLLAYADEGRRSRRQPPEEETDSSQEAERLMGRVLKLDVANPRLLPETGTRREEPGSQGLFRQVFEEDRSFDLERLLKALQEGAEGLRADDRARLSRAWRRRRARVAYEKGLPPYYAGSFEDAARWFRQALRLDPALDRARTGLKECERARAPR